MHLQAVHGTPGPDGGQCPLPTLAEGRFWGEDDALRRRHPNQPLDEALPRRVFTCVKELERRCASHQQVGVWREANMHAAEPCRPSKPLSRGEQAHMPSMQSIKDPKG